MKRLTCLVIMMVALTMHALAQEDHDAIVGDGPGATAIESPSARVEPAEKTETPAATDALSSASESMCLMIESAAHANGLPAEFFARVIWQESRFRPDAIGPVTRSGQRAQ